jgi:prepilin-type processing-associated H-X9-DG protein
MAFKMYTDDNNGVLPSSAIKRVPEAVFRGAKSGTSSQNAATICMLLWPYEKNRQINYCPADPRLSVGLWIFKRDISSETTPLTIPSSYVMKKAVNDAWLDSKVKARKETDFNWPADQMIFYERGSFHWGNEAGDVSDPKNTRKLGATVNCFFFDGHVKAVRVTQFEPDYYNTDGNTGTPTRRPEIDPRRYYDTLN